MKPNYIAVPREVTADIGVYLNCPSRKGFCYVLAHTNIATKMFWECSLKTRSGDEVFTFIRNRVECTLKHIPVTIYYNTIMQMGVQI